MAIGGRAETEPQPFVEGSWTIAVIPDTQYYVRNNKFAPVFSEVTQWLADNRKKLNIQLVLHLGDIVDRNNKTQWRHAKNSLKKLDGRLPYVLTVGNHDLGKNATDRTTMLNDYFRISDNPLNKKIFGGTFQEGRLENAWYRFKYANRDYVIFALEFGPRKEVVAWANKVASKHPDQSFILVTHDFIDQESTLFSDDGMARHTVPSTKNSPNSYGIGKGGNVHCGKQLWDAFVSRHSNFEMVINGHYKPFEKTGSNPNQVKALKALAAAYRGDTYDDGRFAHQILFNAQWAPKGGNGWLRLLEFQPDGKTVRIKTYSPHLDQWRTEKNFQFPVVLSPPVGK